MRQIYLDYNTTTPIAPSVQEAMVLFLTQHFGSPTSLHAIGRASAEALQDARGQVAQAIGADPEEIVFTSGGSESNNLAIKGLLIQRGPIGQGHIVLSAIEHPSVVESVRFLERLGYDVSVVGVTDQGVVQPSAVRELLRADTVLVSVLHASGESGVIQPLRQIAEVCHERNVLLHADAAQTIGKIRTAVDELDVDLMTISGHKCYAPKGVGALFVRRGVALEPWLHGSGEESGLRAGAANVASIVGLGRAMLLAAQCLDATQERLALLRDRLLNLLQRELGEQLVQFGAQAPRLPNTLHVSFPIVTGHDLLGRIPELCAATDSAWHGSVASISPTLAAMGMSAELARGSIRFSLGWQTSESDIDRAASLLVDAWEALS
jgi:cysteine desulfurase